MEGAGNPELGFNAEDSPLHAFHPRPLEASCRASVRAHLSCNGAGLVAQSSARDQPGRPRVGTPQRDNPALAGRRCFEGPLHGRQPQLAVVGGGCRAGQPQGFDPARRTARSGGDRWGQLHHQRPGQTVAAAPPAGLRRSPSGAPAGSAQSPEIIVVSLRPRGVGGGIRHCGDDGKPRGRAGGGSGRGSGGLLPGAYRSALAFRCGCRRADGHRYRAGHPVVVAVADR